MTAILNSRCRLRCGVHITMQGLKKRSSIDMEGQREINEEKNN